MRSHAVSVLQQKDDDELMYYLLQLVQVGLFVWVMDLQGAGLKVAVVTTDLATA